MLSHEEATELAFSDANGEAKLPLDGEPEDAAVLCGVAGAS